MIEASFCFFDHFDYAATVTSSTLQALYNVWVCFMKV
ncbi:hypothetical protein Brsp07_04256 [Brucella sp. NBRC 14130]